MKKLFFRDHRLDMETYYRKVLCDLALIKLVETRAKYSKNDWFRYMLEAWRHLGRARELPEPQRVDIEGAYVAAAILYHFGKGATSLDKVVKGINSLASYNFGK